MKSSKLGIACILLIPIGLVAAPVLWAGMRSEIAHWYVAAAANAIELDRGNPEVSLQSARAWDPQIDQAQDYWTVRLRQLARRSSSDLSTEALAVELQSVPPAQAKMVAGELAREFLRFGEFDKAADVVKTLMGPEANKWVDYWDLRILAAYRSDGAARAVEVLREAAEANKDDPSIASKLGEHYGMVWSIDNEFDAALDALLIGFGEKYTRDKHTLNSLAYTRALALRDLDQALIDINEALSYGTDDPMLRDTKAWVLYRLGKYEEALVDADFAVTQFEKATVGNWLQNMLMSQFNGQGKQSTAPQSAPAPKASNAQDSPNAQDESGGTSEPTETKSAEQTVTPERGEFSEDFLDGFPGMGMHGLPSTKEDRDEYLTSGEADLSIWTRGVMRYHRAKILEKLGKSEEAKADWDWLKEQNLPPDDRLH